MTSGWHPLLPTSELRAGENIVAAFAAGTELALWRAADGTAQAWQNRCPHRSVRFTLGQVVGDRLSCAYHGWQYAAGSGQCAAIPAHPAMPEPRTVCAKVYRAAEAAGMVCARLDAEDAAPPPVDAVPAGWSFCRSLGIEAPASAARAALESRGFRADGSSSWFGALAGTPVVALLLDARDDLAFIHLWTEAAPGSAAMTAVHAEARCLRADIEARAR